MKNTWDEVFDKYRKDMGLKSGEIRNGMYSADFAKYIIQNYKPLKNSSQPILESNIGLLIEYIEQDYPNNHNKLTVRSFINQIKSQL